MSTIAVKVLYGQPKPVMFKLESPNKYLTGSFSPSGCTPEPITNSCQSILTITAHEGIETNTTYDLIVTAQTSNLLSRSTIVRVKVNDVSVNNFGITTLGDTGISLSSKTPPTKSLEQYYAMNAVFVNLEIPAKGYEEFTFSAQGIPSGIRYWFEPTKCRINKGEKTCGTVMRYTISGDAKKGSYTIETVARSSNGGEARNKFKLNVRIDENNNTDYVLYPEEKSTTISPTDNDQSRLLQNFNIVAELLNAFDNYGQKDVYINGYIIPNLPEGTSLVKHNLDNTWSKVSFENWLIKTSNQYQWWLDYSVNTIKVTEPSLVKEGKYDLIIVGKSGELVRTTRKEVIIVTPPAVSDFTLKVTYPATFKDNIIEVKQDGKSDYFTATLQTIIGAPGEVSLKVNPYYLNNGKISVVFEPSSSCYLDYRDTVNSSCERKARVYAEKNTTLGDYQLLLQAQSSQTYHDEILKVRVKQAATTTPPSSGGGGGGRFGPIRP